MIAEFNSSEDYQFTFGNDELARTLKLYNDHVEKQKIHSQNLVGTNKSYDVRTARKLLAEGAKAFEKSVKDQQEKEADARLEEGMHQSQSSNDNFFDNIPESSSTINQIVTPTKDSKITVEITRKRVVITEQQDSTPAKIRRMKTNEEMDTIGKGQRKPNWTDSTKLQILEAWCKTSYTPYLCQNDKSSNKAERDETISQMMRKFSFMVEGREVRLKDLTSNKDNFLWRKLKDNREGLSIDKKMKPLLSHLDDTVRKKYPDIPNSNWNRDHCRAVRDDMLKELYSKCGIKQPDTRQPFDSEDFENPNNALVEESPQKNLETTEENEDENIEENIVQPSTPAKFRHDVANAKRKHKTVQNAQNDPESDWEEEDKKSKKEKKKKKKKPRRAILSSDDESEDDAV